MLELGQAFRTKEPGSTDSKPQDNEKKDLVFICSYIRRRKYNNVDSNYLDQITNAALCQFINQKDSST